MLKLTALPKMKAKRSTWC